MLSVKLTQSIWLFITPCTIQRRRQWHPTPVLLPGKSHGWRSLEGCSPWGRWGSDMTEQLHFHFSLSCIGEGNGNLLQCSCLENPRDRGAWWAVGYGVAQSRTRLKRFSSSSSIYSPWNSPGQNTGVGSLSLLQGLFPTQGSNPGLLHCSQILYQLSHKGSSSFLNEPTEQSKEKASVNEAMMIK